MKAHVQGAYTTCITFTLSQHQLPLSVQFAPLATIVTIHQYFRTEMLQLKDVK